MTPVPNFSYMIFCRRKGFEATDWLPWYDERYNTLKEAQYEIDRISYYQVDYDLKIVKLYFVDNSDNDQIKEERIITV